MCAVISRTPLQDANTRFVSDVWRNRTARRLSTMDNGINASFSLDYVKERKASAAPAGDNLGFARRFKSTAVLNPLLSATRPVGPAVLQFQAASTRFPPPSQAPPPSWSSFSSASVRNPTQARPDARVLRVRVGSPKLPTAGAAQLPVHVMQSAVYGAGRGFVGARGAMMTFSTTAHAAANSRAGFWPSQPARGVTGM